MGCTFDGIKKNQNFDQVHFNRRDRTFSIDARRKSTRVVDNIIQNVIIKNQQITQNQVNFAINALLKTSLFCCLTNQQITVISKLLIPVQALEGQFVFHQGDIGNCFFLIEKGYLQVQINGDPIKTLREGQIFGQIALLLRTKRSASIKCRTNCKLLVMKPLAFKQTIQRLKTYEYEVKRKTIENIQIFQGLTNKQKNSLVNSLKNITFQKGAKIFSQGQNANAFYIINQGAVRIQINNKQVVYLSKYQSFGESAFKINGKRKGSAIAQIKTICSIISKEDLQKNFGTSVDNIYFYNLKKWGLKRSQVFKLYSEFSLNEINMAFQIKYAKSSQKLNSNGQDLIIICLQGKISNEATGTIFGDIQWKNKQKYQKILIKQESGFYASISFVKLNKLLSQINEKKQCRRPSIKNYSNKQNFGAIDLNNFQFIKELGSGQFGKVLCVKDPNFGGRLYALKGISKQQIKKQSLQIYIKQQKKILQKIEFPFIVGFVKSFSDDNNIYFLMEYLKGVQMFNVIRQMPTLNSTIIKYFFSSLLLSIQHLHLNNIIYRDIKPQNSVVDCNGKVFLIDLGTAKFLKKDKSYRTYTVIGTPHYMAPQVFSTLGYSFQADIWSLGVILYQFACGRLPFGQTEEDIYKVMEQIKKNKIKMPSNLDQNLIKLLKLMLNKNSKQRSISATFQKIKQSQYFSGFSWRDMLKQKIYPPYIPKQFKQKGGLKTINLQGQPLVKYLLKDQNIKNEKIVISQWDQKF